MSTKLVFALVAINILTAYWPFVVQCQECDMNCASGCSKAGASRCDGSCYGGFYSTSNNTCSPLANLARGKLAYQITSHSAGNASLAIDGNKTTEFFTGSCSHTGEDTFVINPWWAVDLGQRYSIIGVNFTNRVDCCTSRANQFIVGLTDTPPQPGNLLPLYNYTLCGQYPGSVGAGATVYQPCQSNLMPYRYVIIQVESNITGTTVLTICEAEVYGFECDVNCASGCSRAGAGRCDGSCYSGFYLTSNNTCSPVAATTTTAVRTSTTTPAATTTYVGGSGLSGGGTATTTTAVRTSTTTSVANTTYVGGSGLSGDGGKIGLGVGLSVGLPLIIAFIVIA